MDLLFRYDSSDFTADADADADAFGGIVAIINLGWNTFFDAIYDFKVPSKFLTLCADYFL